MRVMFYFSVCKYFGAGNGLRVRPLRNIQKLLIRMLCYILDCASAKFMLVLADHYYIVVVMFNLQC